MQEGIRYFDMRFSYEGSVGGNKIFQIRHGDYIASATLEDILNETKDFLESSKQELVILNFSHFRNFATISPDGHVTLDKDVYQGFIDEINAQLGEYLYFPPDPSKLTTTTLSDVLCDSDTGDCKSKVLAIVNDVGAEMEPQMFIDKKIIPHYGSQDYFPVYDRWSNTPHLDDMIDDQLDKLKDHHGRSDKLFLLSWTLTEDWWTVVNPINWDSIEDFAYDANPEMDQKIIFDGKGMDYQVNFLYVDWAGGVRAFDIVKTASYLNNHRWFQTESEQ
jgi:hypothetical protein